MTTNSINDYDNNRTKKTTTKSLILINSLSPNAKILINENIHEPFAVTVLIVHAYIIPRKYYNALIFNFEMMMK